MRAFGTAHQTDDADLLDALLAKPDANSSCQSRRDTLVIPTLALPETKTLGRQTRRAIGQKEGSISLQFSKTDTDAPTAGTIGNINMKRVLIVEDDPKIARALILRVKNAGYEVLLAQDAMAGVSTAVKLHPDLVLLDISMPAGSGFTVAERIQTLIPTFTPIIFVTASKKATFREEATRLGAAGYFEKPYDGEALLTSISRAIDASERQVFGGTSWRF